MYCPKCSQEQISDNMRFCSRCGLALAGVTELVANDGISASSKDTAEGQRLSPRQRGVRKALLLLVPSFVLLISAGLIHDKVFDKPSLGEAIILFGPGIMCLTIGLVRLLHALLLEDGAARTTEAFSNTGTKPVGQLGATRIHSALPPAQGVSASSWKQQPNTAEMVQAPSVTEHTTKLLNNSIDPDEHH